MSEGTVYLLHFERPYHHARHYLGWTTDLEGRLARHQAGNGARLLEVIAQAGIRWKLVRTWEGGRDLERRLSHRDPLRGKRQKNSPRLCPICNPKQP